jgi:uncharacterized membrane protein YhaH (DUF805 family)
MPQVEITQGGSIMQCPFCKEIIHDEAIKCKHCGSMLTQPQNFQRPLQQTPFQTSEASGENNNMIDWYLIVLRKYAEFTGRARRKEYWYFMLFNMIIAIILGIIGGIVGAGSTIGNIYNLVVLVPSLAVAIRRLHDTDRSGWWLLLPIVNLFFLAQDSQSGANRFGLNPISE